MALRHRIRMTIYQPRRENVSTYSMTKEELLSWADEVLVPTAKLAYEGKGDFKAGDHCQFCKVKATCRKRAEYNLELARYDFEMPDTLDTDEIAAILPRIDSLVAWAGDVKEYALQQALSGTEYEDLDAPDVSMLYSRVAVTNSLMDKIAAKCHIKAPDGGSSGATETENVTDNGRSAEEIRERLNFIKRFI